MKYRKLYDKLKTLEPKPRGAAFESLINKIFYDKGILIQSRYRTENNEQEIDGAIMLLNRVFLIEVKWEKSETLAASKLYSFLGKVNSKIEGTLGIFISYNTLSDNFINSLRNGIRQNCIVIHGVNNIEDIIDEKVPIVAFLEFCYLQTSTRGIVNLNTSEYRPLKFNKTTVGDNPWLRIYESLVSKDNQSDFSAIFNEYYDATLELSNKTISIYRTLPNDNRILLKYNFLIDELFKREKEQLVNSIKSTLSSVSWKEYADNYFIEILERYKIAFSEGDLTHIISYLEKEFESSPFHEENLISKILDVFFAQYTIKHFKKIIAMYIGIYTDTLRYDYFPQKRFAERVFNFIHRNITTYKNELELVLIDKLKSKKIEMQIEYEDDKGAIEKGTKFAFKVKYKKVFDLMGWNFDVFFKSEYSKL